MQLGLELVGQNRALTVPYRTDASILASMFPWIVLGPGSLEQAHTAEEWVSLDQLDRGVELFEQLIESFCR